MSVQIASIDLQRRPTFPKLSSSGLSGARTFIACVMAMIVVAAIYGLYFGTTQGSRFSRSPEVWAQFAGYWAALSIPVIVSIAIAMVAMHLKQVRLSEERSWLLRQIANSLEHAAPTWSDSVERAVFDMLKERRDLRSDPVFLHVLALCLARSSRYVSSEHAFEHVLSKLSNITTPRQGSSR